MRHNAPSPGPHSSAGSPASRPPGGIRERFGKVSRSGHKSLSRNTQHAATDLFASCKDVDGFQGVDLGQPMSKGSRQHCIVVTCSLECHHPHKLR